MSYVCKNSLCPLHTVCIKMVYGSGPDNAAVVLIGEAPGKTEERRGVVFCGMAGSELDGYLRGVSLSRDNCFTTNILKCRPPNDREPTLEEIKQCYKYLRGELNGKKPRVVGVLGAVAARTLISDDFDMEMGHGIPIRWHTTKAHFDNISGDGLGIDFGNNPAVIPVYHPAAGLRDTAWMAIIREDFKALAAALHGKLSPEDHVDKYPDPIYIELTDDSSIDTLVAQLENVDLVAVDTETDGEVPIMVSLSINPGVAYVIDASYAYGRMAIAYAMRRPSMATILHNALYDIPMLQRMGIYPNHVMDSMVAAYLLQTEPQGLKALAWRYHAMKMSTYAEMLAGVSQDKSLSYLTEVSRHEWPTLDPVLTFDADGTPKVRQPQSLDRRVDRILLDFGKDSSVDLKDRWSNIEKNTRDLVSAVLGPMPGVSLRDINHCDAVNYSARDADATIRVWPFLYNKMEEVGLLDTFDVDMAIIPMIADMQDRGMKISRAHLYGLAKSIISDMDDVGAAIDACVGRHLNPGSPLQLRKFLFDDLRLEAPKKMKSKKTGENSANEKVLSTLRNCHPAIPMIIEWKGKQKLLTSYTTTLIERADDDDRIHPTIRTTRVVSGRLAASNPNLMAIPVKTEDGRRVRDGFIAEDGYELLSADYSQIEMRVVAHESMDTEMMRIFRAGEDIHAVTAARMFGMPIDRLDDMKHRYPAKRVGFGVLNALTAEGLLDQLNYAGCTGWTIKSCAELINDWFGMFPGIKRYFVAKCTEARRYGYVRDMFGRIRMIPEVKSTIRYIVEAGERQACSTVIQAAAQGVIKEAMRQITPLYKALQAEYPGSCYPLMQIHDDLLWEVRADMIDSFAPLLKGVMENAVKLRIPLVVDLKRGVSWGNMVKIKI